MEREEVARGLAKVLEMIKRREGGLDESGRPGLPSVYSLNLKDVGIDEEDFTGLKVKFTLTEGPKTKIEGRSRNVSEESIAAYLEEETGIEDIKVKWLGDGKGSLLKDGKKIGTVSYYADQIFWPQGMEENGTLIL